jgi:hypothetical protein
MNNSNDVNITLVSLYGQKQPELVRLIRLLQAELHNQLGEAFTAYRMEQVHGTIIGLEGTRTNAGIVNTNLYSATGESRTIDFQGLFRFLLNTPMFPMKIRIGGFLQDGEYPFTSRGQHPYIRSFTLQGSHAIVIGWPVKNRTYPMSLDQLRRQCANYNVLHKYHENENNIDNDLFFVLGRIDRDSVPEKKAESIQDSVRRLLSSREPLHMLIEKERLSVVAYKDRQLPTSSSAGYSLTQAQEGIDKIRNLYGYGKM